MKEYKKSYTGFLIILLLYLIAAFLPIFIPAIHDRPGAVTAWMCFATAVFVFITVFYIYKSEKLYLFSVCVDVHIYEHGLEVLRNSCRALDTAKAGEPSIPVYYSPVSKRDTGFALADKLYVFLSFYNCVLIAFNDKVLYYTVIYVMAQTA